MLDKKTYDECVVLLKEKNYCDFERRLSRLNETLVVDYVQDYLECDGNRIKEDLQNSNRFKKIFLIEVRNTLSYQIGVFNTIISVFELLLCRKHKNDSIFKRIKILNAKNNINKILLFLYKHPETQHKVISKEIGLKPNYLSELMRELESEGCVHRYRIGKRSFYTLSNEAKAVIAEDNQRKINDEILRYIEREDRKYEFHMDNQIDTIFNEKYSGVKCYRKIV